MSCSAFSWHWDFLTWTTLIFAQVLYSLWPLSALWGGYIFIFLPITLLLCKVPQNMTIKLLSDQSIMAFSLLLQNFNHFQSPFTKEQQRRNSNSSLSHPHIPKHQKSKSKPKTRLLWLWTCTMFLSAMFISQSFIGLNSLIPPNCKLHEIRGFIIIIILFTVLFRAWNPTGTQIYLLNELGFCWNNTV